MLTQAQADRLIQMLKRAAREEVFIWESAKRQDELVVSVEEPDLHFVLSLRRSPFEIRMHFRTKDRDIGLARVDGHAYHINPDGVELRDQPHLHLYRDGDELKWAEAIDWYDLNDPIKTLEHFLNIIRTRFAAGCQAELF